MDWPMSTVHPRGESATKGHHRSPALFIRTSRNNVLSMPATGLPPLLSSPLFPFPLSKTSPMNFYIISSCTRIVRTNLSFVRSFVVPYSFVSFVTWKSRNDRRKRKRKRKRMNGRTGVTRIRAPPLERARRIGRGEREKVDGTRRDEMETRGGGPSGVGGGVKKVVLRRARQKGGRGNEEPRPGLVNTATESLVFLSTAATMGPQETKDERRAIYFGPLFRSSAESGLLGCLARGGREGGRGTKVM